MTSDKSDREAIRESRVDSLYKQTSSVMHVFANPLSVCGNGDRGWVRNTEEVYCGG